MSEPFDIAQALFDPTRVADGVVSMLDLMGVEVRASDNSILRVGTDRGAGELALTESQIRGLIEMTEEDLVEIGEFGGPFPISDMYEALAPSLPAGYSFDEFTAAYDVAYAGEPESLAAQVMFGQPIEPQTGLLRIQMWLLLIDGFVGPSDGSAGRLGMATGPAGTVFGLSRQQPASNTLGVARQFQPRLQSQDPGLTDAEWAEVLASLPTLVYLIPYRNSYPTVHEGHGGPGNLEAFVVKIGPAKPLYVNGLPGNRVLLEPYAFPPEGVTVTWNSLTEGTLTEHGQLNPSLGTTMQTDTSGAVQTGYTPKAEEANGAGIEVKDFASLYAEVDQFDLVSKAYDLGAALGPAQLLITGRWIVGWPRTFQIAWHELDTIEVSILNIYKFALDVTVGAEVFNLRGEGTDYAEGVLARADDGTYRGVLEADHFGTATGRAFLGLAGSAECADDGVAASQFLYVVGYPVEWSGVVVARDYPIWSGEFGEQDLLLRFYPGGDPDGEYTPCQPRIPFPGGHDRPAGTYIPLNDTRWSTPDMGYQIHLPVEGTLEYEDRTQVLPESQVCSVWHIKVTPSVSIAAPGYSPAPAASPPPPVCVPG